MNRWPVNRYADHISPRPAVTMTIRALQPGQIAPLCERIAPGIERMPGDIAAQLRRDFWKRHDADGAWSTKYAAQAWLANEVAEFEREKIHRAFDEEEIRALAHRWSELCARMVRLEVMQDFARSVGVEAPEVRGRVSRVGAARRLVCPRWWRRQIRKHYTRRAEAHLRARGFVHRRRQVYASDRAVVYRSERKQRDRELLQDLIAVSDAGDQLELWSVVEGSRANPAVRRAELMTRLRGFEEVAQAAGHVAEFVTLTCPSAFHRMHDNGTRNERWRGFTPREGQQWLCKQWARARAKLQRISLRYYGFRIAEPHHDGTPHWHMVLFVQAHEAETLRAVLRGVWLAEFGSEPGASKYRASFKRIDPAKGSACGYLAKYVAKNIDGFGVGGDYETEGQKAAESVARVAAWASTHGIRQFQQLGGPPVSVWRELRRLRGVQLPCDAMERARVAADTGEWAAFIGALGGIERGRQGDVALWTEVTGELSQYEELRGPQVAGVRSVRGPGPGGECAHVAVRVRDLDASSLMRIQVAGGQACAGLLRGHGASVGSRSCSPDASSLSGSSSLIRIRTRTKVWRIERKGHRGSPLLPVASGTGRHDALDGPSSPSAHSLGPVSITVRGSQTVPATGSASARRSGSIRGSPWTH